MAESFQSQRAVKCHQSYKKKMGYSTQTSTQNTWPRNIYYLLFPTILPIDPVCKVLPGVRNTLQEVKNKVVSLTPAGPQINIWILMHRSKAIQRQPYFIGWLTTVTKPLNEWFRGLGIGSKTSLKSLGSGATLWPGYVH